MTGEEFLRALAVEIIAQGDERWWPRYFDAFAALHLVDAVDVETATEIGEEIRAGLTARTGTETQRFSLGWSGRPDRRLRTFPEPEQDPPPWPPAFWVRAMPGDLPWVSGTGGPWFVTRVDDRCYVTAGGSGATPWPLPVFTRPPAGSGPIGLVSVEPMPRLTSSEEAVFGRVVDDRGQTYELSGVSSSGSLGEPGEHRRWNVRSQITPTVPGDAGSLTFATDSGIVTVPLRPPVPVAVSAGDPHPVRSDVDDHLRRSIHDHVWLHLLKPARPLPPLDNIVAALAAVGAVDRRSLLAIECRAVDTALVDGTVTASVPPVYATALAIGPRPDPWLGVAALGALIDHPDGPRLALEALVGHEDRLALEFLQPAHRPDTPGVFADRLIVTGLDDQGGGYVGRDEGGSAGDGVFHLRPALDPNAAELTIHLTGPTTAVSVRVSLSGQR